MGVDCESKATGIFGEPSIGCQHYASNLRPRGGLVSTQGSGCSRLPVPHLLPRNKNNIYKHINIKESDKLNKG